MGKHPREAPTHTHHPMELKRNPLATNTPRPSWLCSFSPSAQTGPNSHALSLQQRNRAPGSISSPEVAGTQPLLVPHFKSIERHELPKFNLFSDCPGGGPWKSARAGASPHTSRWKCSSVTTARMLRPTGRVSWGGRFSSQPRRREKGYLQLKTRVDQGASLTFTLSRIRS